MNRGDVIRTRGLCVPNAALYQTEPRLDMCSELTDYDIMQLNQEKVNTFFYNMHRTIQLFQHKLKVSEGKGWKVWDF